jgi:hypothetical protein
MIATKIMDLIISKTDFKVGLSCARKLWYKKNGYSTVNDDNEYMQYLAKGGYIVGKMAQLIFGGGIDLSYIRDWDEAIETTKKLIRSNENIIIYEAAVCCNHKIVKVDILRKVGNVLDVIEVKSKSQSSDDETETLPQDYLDDVLYQVLTLEEAFSGFLVNGFLFLPDKSKMNEIEGLAGWFIVEDETYEVPELDELPGRTKKFQQPVIKFKYENDAEKEKYLTQLRASSIMELRDIKNLDFKGDWSLAKAVVKNAFDNLYKSVLEGVEGIKDKNCKKCEYASDVDNKNGFKECWQEFDGQELSAFDLYYGGAVVQGKGNYYLNQLIQAKTMSIKDIDLQVLTKGKTPDNHSSRVIRQLLQIDAAHDGKEKVRKDVLTNELDNWIFPLYFIDFETYTGAIPFHKNMRPYELIAFQWSCHKYDLDGTIHHSEWINLEESLPNFRFAESLMKVLGNTGSPLMWSSHENTVLRRILQQMDSQGYQNESLRQWLTTMTHDKSVKREGRLIDMAKVCEISYVHPDCKGKVSIKKILPAIWNSDLNSDLHNHDQFKQYYKKGQDGKIVDPYKTLASVKEFLETSELEAEEVVAEGTAAMKAYFDLMFGKGKNNQAKKKEIEHLLLQYCKLDTLAMVIIYTYWLKLITTSRK